MHVLHDCTLQVMLQPYNCWSKPAPDDAGHSRYGQAAPGAPCWGERPGHCGGELSAAARFQYYACRDAWRNKARDRAASCLAACQVKKPRLAQTTHSLVKLAIALQDGGIVPVSVYMMLRSLWQHGCHLAQAALLIDGAAK